MSVASALRAGIALLDTATRSVQVTVDYYAIASINSSGENQFSGTATSSPTVVMVKDTKRFKDKEMNEATSDMQFIVPRSFACSIGDKFVYDTKTYLVAAIRGVIDPTTTLNFSNELLLVGAE